MKKLKLSKMIGLLLSAALLINTLSVNVVNVSASSRDEVQFSTEINGTGLSNTESDKKEINAKDLSNLLSVDLTKRFEGGTSANDSEESQTAEEAYVQSVISALAKPVGAVGFEEIPTSGMVDVIVWLQELPNSLSEAYGEEKVSQEAPFSETGALARQAISVEFEESINFEYSEVFAGFAMTVPAGAVKRLADIDGVYAVIPDSMMYATDFNPDPNYEFIGMGESREALGINQIHEAGYTGAGIIVGVLDTGVDYNHPDLKDNYKGGYNFILPAADHGVRNRPADDPMETTYEQWKASGQPETSASGSTYYTTHGSHVSGTVAAQGKNNEDNLYKALGMAPDVELYVARVLGPYGSGATSGTMAAMDDFASDGGNLPKADVINLSLGADYNTAYAANVFTLNNAVIAGVNVAVSAGNNAGSTAENRSLLTLGIPGTAYLPITVAASQYGGTASTTYDAVTALSDNGTDDFGLLLEGQDISNIFSNNVITGNPAPAYVEGKGYLAYLAFGPNDTNPTIEQLEAIPDNSLYGKVLVVKRGLDFTFFAEQAKRTGAGALIIVNRAGADAGERYITNMTIGGIKKDHLPIFSAYHSTSAKLTALAEEDTQVYLQLGNITKSQLAYEPAYFSSIGPVTETIGLKPDIIAPGWNIMSTQPAFAVNTDHDPDDFIAAYGSKSGTSMSAPHIAGILALMKQAYPNATPAEIKARLMNTSDPDLIMALPKGPDGEITEASVFEVGAGFVDPVRAILTDKSVYITVTDDVPGETPETPIVNQTLSSLSFGFAGVGSESRKIPVTVHNAFSFTIDVTYNNNTRYSNDAAANGVVLKYDAPVAGKFNAWVEIPADAEKGLYEGRIVITTGGKSYVVPWAVSAGDGYPDFALDFCVERPIVSTTTNGAIRASAYANATALFFWWDGLWPDGESDILLIDADTGKQAYYYNTIGPLGVGNGGITVVSNVINYWAYPINADGSIGNAEIIKNGAYRVAMTAGEDVIVSSGVVFTNERPILTFDDVEIDMDPEVTSVDVTGSIYSEALELANQHGFTYDELDLYVMGFDVPVDQSFNVLAADATSGILGTFGIYADGDGNFKFPVTGITQDAKINEAYVLGSYKIVGVDFYSWNYPGGWIEHGNNKSEWVMPKFKPIGIFSDLSIDNENGILTATIENAPETCVEDDFDLSFLVNGDDYDVDNFVYDYDEATEVGTATWEFVTVVSDVSEVQVISAYAIYKGIELYAQYVVEPLLPYIYGDYRYYELASPSSVSFAISLGHDGYAATGIEKITLTSGSSIAPSELIPLQDYYNDTESLTIDVSYLESLSLEAGDVVEFEVEFNNTQSTVAGIFIEAIPGYVVVDFNSNGGSLVESQLVEIGKTAYEPRIPERQGYLFDGWYLDDGTFSQPWDFDNDVVEEATTLYAKWIKLHTVTFDTNDGNEIDPQTIIDGGKVVKPADPIRTGYIFDNWYSDESFEKLWDFDTVVKSDIVLYAKWIKVYTVAFNSNGGSFIEAVFVKEGETVSKPADPVRKGFIFGGWYEDARPWNFATDKVNDHVILNAKWSAIPVPTPAPTPTPRPIPTPGPVAPTPTPVPGGGSGPVYTPVPIDTPIDVNHSIEVALNTSGGGNVNINILRDTAVVDMSGANLLDVAAAGKGLVIHGANIDLILDTAFINSLGLTQNDSFEIRFSPVRASVKSDVSKVDRANDRLLAHAFDISVYVNGVKRDAFTSPITIKLSLKMLGLNDNQKSKLTGVRFNNDGSHTQLGGKVVPGDAFEFVTSSLSRYGLLITDKIVTISAAIGRSTFTVNNESRTSDVAPFIKDGSTMVPVRFIAEAFGATVGWVDSTKTVNITLDGQYLSFKIGALYDGMSTPAVIVDDRTYVPLRYVSEKLGGNVVWYGSTYSIDITK